MVRESFGAATRRPGSANERRAPLLRAMQIVERIATSDQSTWGVRELARTLGTPPSSVHRLLAMLEEAAILEANANTGRYSISVDFYRLASRIALKFPLRETASRHLVELAERTGEATFLARYESRKMSFMYIDFVRSTHPLRYELPMYEWLDLRVGAGGMAILAYLSSPELDAVLGQPAPERLTERTITERQLIERELEEVRARGYVVSTGRRIVGAVGVAAPIMGRNGRVLGALVLALPEARFPTYDVGCLAADVVATAHTLSVMLASEESHVARAAGDLTSW